MGVRRWGHRGEIRKAPESEHIWWDGPCAIKQHSTVREIPGNFKNKGLSNFQRFL